MLRRFYFSMAALWGFGVGTIALVAAMSRKGTRVPLGPADAAIIGPAIALTLAGGFVAAAAYREARRRSRG